MEVKKYFVFCVNFRYFSYRISYFANICRFTFCLCIYPDQLAVIIALFSCTDSVHICTFIKHFILCVGFYVQYT